MVDSEDVGLKENEDFGSDFYSNEKKLDSKNEPDQSFYECPTAAQSIQGFGEGDGYNSQSVDSDQEYGFFEPSVTTDFQQFSTSTDGGSVSISQFTKATGGYFAGFKAVLFQGTPTLKEKPASFLNEGSLNVADGGPHVATYPQMGAEDSTNAEKATPFVTEGTVRDGLSVESSLPTLQPTVVSVRTDNFASVHDGQNTTSNSISSLTPGGASKLPSVLLPAVLEDPKLNPGYGVEVDKSSSGVSYVQEGFDTITVPRYRPVEVIERTVEVPVVHHIDTFVPKKEIQEVQTYVKKPYTRYMDKLVEVPQVYYTDKIVEVPEYHEVTKTVPKLEVQEKTDYVPKVEVKVVPKYVEVPVVKIVDKYEEYEEVEEVVKHVEKLEVVEVPREVVKHVVKPVKKIVEREKIVPVYQHRDVPVEKIKYVPKVETVEHLREVPKVVDVPVPYNVPKHHYVDQPYVVPKYRDVPVAVPVSKTVKPVYEYKGPTNYVDVPVHKPYFVIHDHLNFKPVANFTASPGTHGVPNPGFTTATNLNPGFPQNSGSATVTGFNPGFPQNPGPTTGTGFNGGFGGNAAVTESVSYKVVGMNKVDLDKMSAEDKKLAKEKLDEALNNPNFQVYKQSLQAPNPPAAGADFAVGPTFIPTQNFNQTANAEGFNAWNAAPASTQNPTTLNTDAAFKTDYNPAQNSAASSDSAKQFDSPSGLNFDFKNAASSTFAPNLNSFGSFSTNAPGSWAWNARPSDLGAKQPAPAWNRAGQYEPSGSFSDPNFSNRYNLGANYSDNPLFNWTEKVFKFFTGSKSPLGSFNSRTFNPPPFNAVNPNFAARPQPPAPGPTASTVPKGFPAAAGTGSSDNVFKSPGYNLVQEPLMNWKAPNLQLNLGVGTPTNLPFRATNPYHMSSGSGSVGHRAAAFNAQVYPASDATSPKVH